MYQAKVNFMIFRQMKTNLTLKRLKNKFNKSGGNIMNRKKESR